MSHAHNCLMGDFPRAYARGDLCIVMDGLSEISIARGAMRAELTVLFTAGTLTSRTLWVLDAPPHPAVWVITYDAEVDMVTVAEPGRSAITLTRTRTPEPPRLLVRQPERPLVHIGTWTIAGAPHGGVCGVIIIRADARSGTLYAALQPAGDDTIRREWSIVETPIRFNFMGHALKLDVEADPSAPLFRGVLTGHRSILPVPPPPPPCSLAGCCCAEMN
jgi:hypothetical protein